MTADQITQLVERLGVSGLILFCLFLLGRQIFGKWVPAVATWANKEIVEWAKNIVERLTISSEETARAVSKLVVAEEHDKINHSVKLRVLHRTAKLVVLSVPKEKEDEASRLFLEIEKLIESP